MKNKSNKYTSKLNTDPAKAKAKKIKKSNGHIGGVRVTLLVDKPCRAKHPRVQNLSTSLWCDYI